MMNKKIAEKLKTLPNSSGVYIMLDNSGEIIYVGKARVLKNRVRQYFQNSDKPIKVQAMVAKIEDFRYIITQNEVDALILENNLIKKHKPYYNILLKDDKNYAYIRIDMKEDFPRLELTRKLKSDGAKYFGPFMQGISVREVIDIVNAAYPVRGCKKTLPQSRVQRPCLNYHIGRCLAPCSGEVSREEYHAILDKVVEFLKGNDSDVRKVLEKKMTDSAEALDFESAISYRKHLEALDKLVRDSITALPRDLSAEIFELRARGDKCVVGVLSIRSGKMVGGDNYEIADFESGESLPSFIAEYYESAEFVPKKIIVKEDERGLIQEYLGEIGSKCRVEIPQKGVLKKLLDMAGENAENYLNRLLGERAEALKYEEAMKEVGVALGIAPPSRVECYDISNISGTLKVSSMVVFINGKKAPAEYRRFRIKTVEGSDDFACMAETLSRRVEKYKEQDPSFSQKPDLIVVDGGKGQLSSAYSIICEKGFDTAMVGLAKREELLFKPNESEPIVMSKKSAGLMMLQRIRDEAHRFAITYHRKLRADNMTRSVLSEIPGIGKVKIDILYKAFKSVDALSKAKVEEISSVKGISKKDAENVFEYFHAKD
ncbi:MAG: excinuclease ABC subunit UvrC [Clostridia bacterium]|nr:excinuclease ABC subunit UvrC [Clostridia bacterium]